MNTDDSDRGDQLFLIRWRITTDLVYFQIKSKRIRRNLESDNNKSDDSSVNCAVINIKIGHGFASYIV